MISAHALNISRGATGIISAFTAFALLCWAFLIILFLSATAFLILAGAVIFVVIVFNANQARMTAWLTASVKQDNRFVQAFGDLIDGFKELKMDPAKADDFVELSVKPLAAEIDARLCLFHPRADEARVPPEQRTGLSECVNLAGAFDHEFTQTPLAKHASLADLL